MSRAIPRVVSIPTVKARGLIFRVRLILISPGRFEGDLEASEAIVQADLFGTDGRFSPDVEYQTHAEIGPVVWRNSKTLTWSV